MYTLTHQQAKTKSPNFIFVDEKIINNTVEIAKKFNRHFCRIGKKYLIPFAPQRHLSFMFFYQNV